MSNIQRITTKSKKKKPHAVNNHSQNLDPRIEAHKRILRAARNYQPPPYLDIPEIYEALKTKNPELLLRFVKEELDETNRIGPWRLAGKPLLVEKDCVILGGGLQPDWLWWHDAVYGYKYKEIVKWWKELIDFASLSLLWGQQYEDILEEIKNKHKQLIASYRYWISELKGGRPKKDPRINKEIKELYNTLYLALQNYFSKHHPSLIKAIKSGKSHKLRFKDDTGIGHILTNFWVQQNGELPLKNKLAISQELRKASTWQPKETNTIHKIVLLILATEFVNEKKKTINEKQKTITDLLSISRQNPS